MQKSAAMALIVLMVAVIGFMASPITGNPANLASPSSPHLGSAPTAAPSTFHPVVASIAPSATQTFPRTLLIEAFTAQWCVWCPEESHAMYTIEHQFNRSVLDIGELHVCYSSSNCGDNYNTADNISADRQIFYSVSGIPTSVFDGYQIVGSNANESMLLAQYEAAVAKEMAWPGNVSIVQSAIYSTPTDVSVKAEVDSGITGTYHALSYLEEYVDKNISSTGGVHDMGYVVRGAAIDQNVVLTAGTTTDISGSIALQAGWNPANMSEVTFIQQNSSMDIENANLVPVTNLQSDVSASPSSTPAGTEVGVSVTVTNTSTGMPVSGATVSLASNGGGSLAAPTGVTAANGTYWTTFTAPVVTSTTTIDLTATTTAPGYYTSIATGTVTVTPVTPPGVPLALNLAPAMGHAVLTWSAPASGGSGVVYHLFRSTTQVGGYSEVASTSSTSYVDTTVTPGQSYFYTVSASNTGGWSVNATEITANSVRVSAQGLPSGTGWWIEIASSQFNASSGATVGLYLPNGLYPYSITSSSYEYIATPSNGNLTLIGASEQVAATFAIRFATLSISVTPADASVTVDGLSVTLTDGTASEPLSQGNYTVNVTSSGYVTNTSVVSLTWGNTTPLSVALTQKSGHPVNNPSSPTGSGMTIGGLPDWVLGAIFAAAGALVVIAFVARSMSQRGPPPKKP